LPLGSSPLKRLEFLLGYWPWSACFFSERIFDSSKKLTSLAISTNSGWGCAHSRLEVFRLFSLSRLIGLALSLIFFSIPYFALPNESGARNSWRGITPLVSSGADVAKLVANQGEAAEDMPVGPFKVEGGEVTFSYLTPSLARIFKAPKPMVGKVFTIYFKPFGATPRAQLTLGPTFKRCQEQLGKASYYYVSPAGVAYQFQRSNDLLEMVIYQPTQAQVQRLAVNTECVF